jgi:aspartate dehydrogenase
MTLNVAIAGLGAIGLPVAHALHQGIDGLRLVGVIAGRRDIAEHRLHEAGIAVPIADAAAMAAEADIIVECVPARAFRSIAEPVVTAGRMLVTVSGAGLLEASDLIALAERKNARIVLVTGALLGLDAVRAAAEGLIHSVRMTSRKPPKSLRGAPYLAAHRIDVDAIDHATRVFQGTAREGARGFPANVNVAAALSLAGIGPDKTMLEIWADPEVTRNIHTIEVDADSARFTMTIENVPSAENPSTARITALSVIAALRGLGSTLRIGS